MNLDPSWNELLSHLKSYDGWNGTWLWLTLFSRLCNLFDQIESRVKVRFQLQKMLFWFSVLCPINHSFNIQWSLYHIPVRDSQTSSLTSWRVCQSSYHLPIGRWHGHHDIKQSFSTWHGRQSAVNWSAKVWCRVISQTPANVSHLWHWQV